MADYKDNQIAPIEKAATGSNRDDLKSTKETTPTTSAHASSRRVARGGDNSSPVTPGKRVTIRSASLFGPGNEGDDDRGVYSSSLSSKTAVESEPSVEFGTLVNSKSPSESEKHHIILTYLSLLALSRNSLRPVIELSMDTQLLQLDAFLAGHITADGDATQWLPESETPMRRQHYADLCAELVPNLTVTITRQSQENWNAERKNQAQGGNNPEHKMFSKIYLAPELVKSYGELVEIWRRDDKDFNLDMDPWTEPQRYNGLIDLLNAISVIQYDFKNWRHVSPEPEFNQMLRPDGVEFQRVMRDPSSIRACYRVTTPQGKQFWQDQIIPEINEKITEYECMQIWQLKKPGSIYLLPDPKDVSIPRLPKDRVWIKSDENGQEWICSVNKWSPTLIFYVFDKKTNAYINHHVLPPYLLDTMDLNDRAWSVSYRKRIAQWRNRATLQSTTTREPWSIEERAAVYEWANAYCKDNGIDELRIAVADQKRKYIHDVVKKSDDHGRSAESIAAWVRHEMSKKPKEPLGLLYVEHLRVLAMVNAGEKVPGRVQFPDQFIDVDKFKNEAQAKAAAKESSRREKKRKRGKNDGSDGDESVVDDADRSISVESYENIAKDPRNNDLEDDATDEIGEAYDREESCNIPQGCHDRAKIYPKGKGKQRGEVAEKQPHLKLYIKLKGMTKDEEMAAAEAAGRAADRAAATAEGDH
ncbi:hypothetical protein PtrSN002B_011584 [Pyrenophora tritici-repentis]|uniref:Uncharacterized protein n=3 Tax=Pyrenophora tritici-repentis TaxID=45151 RepID=A0A2W1DIB8_9PLEO|nr:uncharacterized protein PTRG_01662 [Pyrenophora tritici-repentis Pt-1C-BFP]KAG9388500.1 hypothetical protein A1F94_001392 [Pyrenophora tritici-repentis]EDU41100.1 predicted protein [Pyrenophora tritici-repentis Pt-1C-BFP]KAI1513804.1 hypothetical protein Ptr86124_007706 [Pyrenophora tritici-repentis]KAI1522993.1 hypothetical protein PtrSN001A_011497 [Pyrenophora tritici-repentis]KAI1523214.1 hypothetical protein PtrSN001C_011537 [Pyrenophora tritici-repentis]